MQSKVSGNWGIELRGAERDLTAWRIQLKPPFDPFVEEVIDERGSSPVLRSTTFKGMANYNEVYAAAKPLLKTLNVAMSKNADADPVTCGPIVEYVVDGAPRKHCVIEVEPIHLRLRVGLESITVTDAKGNVINPKPAPSRAQEWMRAAALVPDIGAAIRYLHGRPGWVELYKAYEAVKAMPNGGLSKAEIRRFKQTANAEDRHHPTQKNTPHSRPMDLWEARALITRWVSAAIDDVLLKNPLMPATNSE